MKRWWWLVWAILCVAGGFIALEAYAISTGGPTLSRTIVELTYQSPLVPFVMGFGMGLLAGHFWWPFQPHWPKGKIDEQRPN